MIWYEKQDNFNTRYCTCLYVYDFIGNNRLIIEISNYRIIIVTIEEFLKNIYLNIFGVFVLVVEWTIIVIIMTWTHDNNHMAKMSYCSSLLVTSTLKN